MSRKPKPIPRFKSEAEERRYRETHASDQHLDWSKAERVRLPNLKSSTTSISLRLPVALLERIKIVVGGHRRNGRGRHPAWF